MNKKERVQEMLLEWREVFFKNLNQRFDKKETTDKIYNDLTKNNKMNQYLRSYFTQWNSCFGVMFKYGQFLTSMQV